VVTAGWSSPVARWAHNPKVAGSNPAPATKEIKGLGIAPGALRRFELVTLPETLPTAAAGGDAREVLDDVTTAQIAGYGLSIISGMLATLTIMLADGERLWAPLIPFHLWTALAVLWVLGFTFACGFALGRNTKR
jgi:hypothetical protein